MKAPCVGLSCKPLYGLPCCFHLVCLQFSEYYYLDHAWVHGLQSIDTKRSAVPIHICTDDFTLLFCLTSTDSKMEH